MDMDMDHTHMHMHMHMHMCMHMCNMSLHALVLLYPHGAQERGSTGSDCVRSVLLSAVRLSALLSGHCVLSGCQAAVRLSR